MPWLRFGDDAEQLMQPGLIRKMEALHFVVDQMFLLFSPVPCESVVSWFNELNQRKTFASFSMELIFAWCSSLNCLNGLAHGEQQEHIAEKRERK